jgi:hypothetical protein
MQATINHCRLLTVQLPTGTASLGLFRGGSIRYSCDPLNDRHIISGSRGAMKRNESKQSAYVLRVFFYENSDCQCHMDVFGDRSE